MSSFGLPTDAEYKSFIKRLQDELIVLIGDDLGKYEIFASDQSTIPISEIPAIVAEPPPFKNNVRRFKNNFSTDDPPQELSSIECIINLTAQVDREPMIGGGNKICFHYCLQLTQYAIAYSLQAITTKIVTCPKFFIVKDPVIRPFQELNDSYLYEQSKIYITAYEYVNQTVNL